MDSCLHRITDVLLACKSAGLKKITLKPGRWYEGGGAGDDRKIKFQ